MAKKIEQGAEVEKRDGRHLHTILNRAVANTTWPREARDKYVHHVREALKIFVDTTTALTTEPKRAKAKGAAA